MELSIHTLELYNRYLKRLELLKIDIYDIEVMTKYLSTLTDNVKRATMLSIMHKLNKEKIPDELLEFYKVRLRECRIMSTLLRTKRKPTEKEVKSHLKWERVISLRELFKSEYKTIKEHMKYVTLCLFTMIPPQRGQAFYNCYIDKDVEGSNIFDTEDKKLILREYKTKKAYGVKQLELPDELVDIVKNWKEKNGNTKGLLIFNNKGEMFSTTNFTSFMNTIFNNTVSTDMLRKIYVSEHINEKTPLEERERLANLMGHSVMEQEFYYNKDGF